MAPSVADARLPDRARNALGTCRCTRPPPLDHRAGRGGLPPGRATRQLSGIIFINTWRRYVPGRWLPDRATPASVALDRTPSMTGTNRRVARCGDSRPPTSPRARSVIQGVVDNGYALVFSAFSSRVTSDVDGCLTGRPQIVPIGVAVATKSENPGLLRKAGAYRPDGVRGWGLGGTPTRH